MNIQLVGFSLRVQIFREKAVERERSEACFQLPIMTSCHGNFQRFVRDVEGVDFFSPGA